MVLQSSEAFLNKLQSYPSEVKPHLDKLRALVHSAAKDLEINHLEECLKWGEPSFVVKGGSTLRMDWKEKAPQQYSLYFKCTSKLVPTFRILYGDCFNFENNRAINFPLGEPILEKEVKACIKMALNYHQLKEFPLLGN